MRCNSGGYDFKRNAFTGKEADRDSVSCGASDWHERDVGKEYALSECLACCLGSWVDAESAAITRTPLGVVDCRESHSCAAEAATSKSPSNIGKAGYP